MSTKSKNLLAYLKDLENEAKELVTTSKARVDLLRAELQVASAEHRTAKEKLIRIRAENRDLRQMKKEEKHKKRLAGYQPMLQWPNRLGQVMLPIPRHFY